MNPIHPRTSRALRVSRLVSALEVTLLLLAAPAVAGTPPALGTGTPPISSRPGIGPVTAGAVLGLGILALSTRKWEGEAALLGTTDRTPLDPALDMGNVYGNGLPLGGASLGILAVGALRHDPATLSLGRELTTSLALAWATTWGLKLAVHSRRPNGGPYSFPSGHTATAFAAAPILAAHFGTAAGIAAYSVAGCTGLARIEDDKHYAIDVLGGAAIGILAGRFSLHLWGTNVAMTPVPGGVGVSASF